MNNSSIVSGQLFITSPLEVTDLASRPCTGEPLVASVWRRQTFSAAVDSLDPSMAIALFMEHLPHLFQLINPSPQELSPSLGSVLEASYTFSRMLHASKSATGGGGSMESSGFYRSFVPDLGSTLDPTKLGKFLFFLRPYPSDNSNALFLWCRTNQKVLSDRARFVHPSRLR